MTREFVYLDVFDKNWAELGLSDDDLSAFEQYLLKKPDAGKIIRGTGGVRKLRVSVSEDKGKSGGARVLYVDFASYKQAWVLNVYSKKWRDNISMADRAAYKRLVGEIVKNLRREEA